MQKSKVRVLCSSWTGIGSSLWTFIGMERKFFGVTLWLSNDKELNGDGSFEGTLEGRRSTMEEISSFRFDSENELTFGMRLTRGWIDWYFTLGRSVIGPPTNIAWIVKPATAGDSQQYNLCIHCHNLIQTIMLGQWNKINCKQISQDDLVQMKKKYILKSKFEVENFSFREKRNNISNLLAEWQLNIHFFYEINRSISLRLCLKLPIKTAAWYYLVNELFSIHPLW